MDQSNHKKQNKAWLIFCAVYAVAMLFLLFIINLESINHWLGNILTVFRPVLIGLVLAYLCNPMFRLFERKLFYKVRPYTLRRTLALIFTYLVVFLIIVFFLLLLIPQLVSSILNFVDNYDAYMVSVIDLINGTITKMNVKFSSSIKLLDVNEIKTSIDGFISSIDADFFMDLLKDIDIAQVGAILRSVLTILLDIVFGFFISLYLLVSKEKRYAQVMRARRAMFSDSVNERITQVCETTNRSFGGFFRGKLLDSFIIAVLIYIFISIFGINYPLLIATIIGITDIIPIIGPIIGVFPAGFIILLSQPEKLIPFIIIVILVQQLDGNIISPKILGENTGVSSLCVLIAISTMGTLMGFVGMIIGVPLFATVLELSDKYLEKRLRQKGRPSASEEYYTEEAPKKHGKLYKRYERKMLRLKRESLADGGVGDLTKFEKFQLDTYNLACKYNVFSEFSEESLAQFAAEEAAIAATVEQDRNAAEDSKDNT